MTDPTYLAALGARCAACDHTAAWHVVDGRCAYRTVSERKGGCVTDAQPAEWCGCTEESAHGD